MPRLHAGKSFFEIQKGDFMNKGVALVGGVGLGAALMYLFDPDRGKRRRALIRDKFEAAGNKASDLTGKMSRDLRNRAYGLAAETKSLFKHEEVSDDVLLDRVRSKIGRQPVHVGAISVTANNGVVTLRGPVLANEVPKLLRAVKFVRGVKGVDNRLDVHEEAGDIPSLQGTPQPLGA
jgi:osmotically-inducible protein OsmY